MEARCSIQLSHSFVVDSDHIKKIYRLLSDRIGNPEIEVDCTDDVSRKFDNADKLLQYENVPTKQIKRLTLRAYSAYSENSEDSKKSARVEFAASGLSGISLDLDASDVVVSRLRLDLGDVIAGSKAWYSAIGKIDFVIGFLSILFAAWVVSAAAVGLGWIQSSDGDSGDNLRVQAIGSLITWCFPLLIVGVGIGFNRLRRLIFPFGSFLIGQGIQRHGILEKVRWAVIVGFIVSLSAGIATTLW